MGLWCNSIYAKGIEGAAFRASIEALTREAGGAVYVVQDSNGWHAAYPNTRLFEFLQDEHLAKIPAAHVLLVMVCDSDVFIYTHFNNGQVVDRYNSCPDYFGECDQRDMDAAGNANTFRGLVSSDDLPKLRALLKPRMINGEEVDGPTPVFEEERAEEFGRLLGIPGILLTCESIEEGYAELPQNFGVPERIG